MKVIGVQMQARLGDFDHNARAMLSFIKKAPKCDLIVFPEMALSGYWPGGLLERPRFFQKQKDALEKLRQQMPPHIAVLLGAITFNKKKYGKYYHNSAVLLKKGRKPQVFHKTILPTYDVFDEGRYFEPGSFEDNIIRIKGQRVLVTICEDIWTSDAKAWAGSRSPQNPLRYIKKGSIDFVVNLSASPFSIGKVERRLHVIRQVVKKLQVPMLYVNLVGGQDEIIFDGGSVLVDKKGQLQLQFECFKEDMMCYDLQTQAQMPLVVKDHTKPLPSFKKTIWNVKQALVLGIKDFVKDSGFERVHLGLSGGIDSAVVACLAVEALGSLNVTTITLSGPFSTDLSCSLAQKLIKKLGCPCMSLPIEDIYKQAFKDLEAHDISCSKVTSENVQARLRCLYLMAFANDRQSLLLSTSNKSEIAVGYTTLYGDMSGALAPIGDLLKTQVYELAKTCYGDVIPSKIISRPATAELKRGQKDTDSLFAYEKMDPRIDDLVVGCKPASGAMDRWILEKLRGSEFKRWQAPPILRISNHAFGSGRRYPIHHFAPI